MPELSDLLKNMMGKPSPIRQIMKMASRKNIIDMGLDPDEVISYGGGWVGHHAPELFRQKYVEICSDIERFHDAGKYSPTLGFPEARKAIASMEKELFGVNLQEENVIIGAASTQLTHDVFITLANSGDNVLMLDPTYANYDGQVEMALQGSRIVRLPVLEPESWDYIPSNDELVEKFKEIVEKEKPKIVIFPSPDNPSSQIIPHEVVKAFMDICEERKIFLVIDHAYKTQCFEERTQQCSILCPDTLHQIAMTEYLNQALEDGSLKKYLDESRAAYKRAADVTVKAIEEYLGMPHLIPQGGLYTLMKVDEDGDEFVKRVLKNTGVLFIPGKGFGSTLKEGVRISYGPHVENVEVIKEGFERVAEYLGKI